jgi:hypothetical protein
MTSEMCWRTVVALGRLAADGIVMRTLATPSRGGRGGPGADPHRRRERGTRRGDVGLERPQLPSEGHGRKHSRPSMALSATKPGI